MLHKCLRQKVKWLDFLIYIKVERDYIDQIVAFKFLSPAPTPGRTTIHTGSVLMEGQ